MQTKQGISAHSSREDSDVTRAPGRVEPPEPKGFTLDRVLRFLLWAGAFAAIGWATWYFLGLVVYLIIGGLLAYLTQPMVDGLRAMGMGKMMSIAIIFLLLFGSLVGLIILLAPYAITQATEMAQHVSIDALTEIVESLEDQLLIYLPFLQQGILVESLEDIAQTLFHDDQIAGTVSSVVSLFTHIFYAALAIPFITFFFLKDGTRLRHQVLRLVPNRYFEISLAILAKVEDSLGRYLRALVLQCSSVAVVASFLLYIVGLNYAVAVGIFAGLANSIPYFGPLMGFIAGSLVGIVQTGDFTMIPYVLVAMALTQAADNVFFQPLIFSRAAQAHPLVILFVVLIGAQLGGIVGMLIAIPLATILRVIIQQVLWSIRNYRVLHSRR